MEEAKEPTIDELKSQVALLNQRMSAIAQQRNEATGRVNDLAILLAEKDAQITELTKTRNGATNDG